MTGAGWILIIGNCMALDCWNVSPPELATLTFSSEYTCRIAGSLTDVIANQRTEPYITAIHECYDLANE